MKNYRTPRMLRESSLQGIGWEPEVSVKWSWLFAYGIVGFLIGVLV